MEGNFRLKVGHGNLDFMLGPKGERKGVFHFRKGPGVSSWKFEFAGWSRGSGSESSLKDGFCFDRFDPMELANTFGGFCLQFDGSRWKRSARCRIIIGLR